MKYKPYAWAVALTVSVAMSNSSLATTTEQLDLSGMADAASAIVTAEVVSSEVQSTDNRSRTLVTLRVTDEIKGDTEEFITVELPGGSFSRGRFRIGQVSAGTPQLYPNQDALLFLAGTQQTNTYKIVGHSQGYMAIREVSGEPVLQNTTTGGAGVPVSEMKQKIIEMEAQ